MNIPRLIQQNFDRLQENHRKEMNESLDAHANYIQSMRSDLDTANHEIEVLRLAIKMRTCNPTPEICEGLCDDYCDWYPPKEDDPNCNNRRYEATIKCAREQLAKDGAE